MTQIGAANTSERPWAYVKINGAATVREWSVLLKSPVLPPASGPPKGIKTGGFSTERSLRHGRYGDLACHCRSRLSFLLRHTLDDEQITA